MPCDECDRLRRENRELKEEIAEYQRPESDLDAHRILKWLGKPAEPQTVKVIMAVAQTAGHVVFAEEIMDRAGLSKNLHPRKSLMVHVARARRCFERRGFKNAIENSYGMGYVMDRAAGRAVVSAGASA